MKQWCEKLESLSVAFLVPNFSLRIPTVKMPGEHAVPIEKQSQVWCMFPRCQCCKRVSQWWCAARLSPTLAALRPCVAFGFHQTFADKNACVYNASLEALGWRLAPSVRRPDVASELLNDCQELRVLGRLRMTRSVASDQSEVDGAWAVAGLQGCTRLALTRRVSWARVFVHDLYGLQ